MNSRNYTLDFPLLHHLDEKALTIAYLDNAATTQKPQQVIDAVIYYYENYNANAHRGAYSISEKATSTFEEVRVKVARFIGSNEQNIAFSFGTTDSINQIAHYYATQLKEGDEILVSITEHHSNMLPWQQVAAVTGATVGYLYPDSSGRITPKELRSKLTPRTALVAITHISNVLGGVNPIRELTELAHNVGAVVVLDAAQSVAHIPIDVVDLDVDYMAFSGHKMYAPAGVGVLYGKKELLQQMQPDRLGGGIVEHVTLSGAKLIDSPMKFEAGTQNAEGVIGLGAAIDYLQEIGMKKIQHIEHELMEFAYDELSKVEHLTIYGDNQHYHRSGILSFNIDNVHPHDTATIVSSHNVAIRSGHHCAQPLMDYLQVNATCRLSLSFYNTKDDIRRLVQALKEVREVVGIES